MFSQVQAAGADFADKSLDTPQLISRLMTQLSGDKAAKIQAIKTLHQQGAKAYDWLPSLTTLLKDPDLQVRAQAASCILGIDSGRIDALTVLTDLLKNRDTTARQQATIAIGQAGVSALPLLRELIGVLQGDISPNVRERAAWAIGQIGPKAKDAIPNLIEALKKNHPYENFRDPQLKVMDDAIYKTCIDSLGSIGTGSSLACSVLTTLVASSGKPALQNEALKTLSRMGGGASSAATVLAGQIADAPDKRKVELINALKAIGPSSSPALPQLNECMASPEPSVRRAALSAILVIESNEKTKQVLLSNMANDPDESIKKTAAEALAESTAGSPEELKALIENADHGKNDVKLSSIIALGNYGGLAADALPMLVKDYLSSGVMPQQRKAAFEAMKKIDPSGAQIIPMVRDNLKDPFKARAAIELLEFIGSEQCKKLAQPARAQWHM